MSIGGANKVVIRFVIGFACAASGILTGAEPSKIAAAAHAAGMDATAQRRYGAAVYHLEQAVRVAPEEFSYQLALGIAYSQNGNFEKAIQTLTKLIAKQPDSWEANFNLGTVYTQQSRYEDALPYYRRALQLNAASDEVRLSLAIAVQASRRDIEAIPLLVAFSAKKPDDEQGYR
jgi:Flp pilus assembly protein TadD